MDSAKMIKNVEKVIEDIRNYTTSQKELWQKVPLLALEADGRTGFKDNYSRAYNHGFWALEGSVNNGYYSVYVDLATGDLINPYVSLNRVFEPAGKESVLKLALNLNELDAQRIVTNLEEKAQKPYSSFYNLDKHEEWRNETRAKLNLQEFYVR